MSHQISNFEFVKGHGLGNDFILFDQREFDVPEGALARMARKICRRKFSIGADGMLLVCEPTSPEYDIQLRIFNDDGSEAEMAGIGIIITAKYLYEHGVVQNPKINIETKRGLVIAELVLDGRAVTAVRVDMGAPIVDPRKIPVKASKPVFDQPIFLEDKEFRYSAVSMGNPHAVIFTEDINLAIVKRYGSFLESKTDLFPKKTNVEFVRVITETEADIRVFERGVGLIQASGTGASAAAVAGIEIGHFQKDNPITFHNMEGDLIVTVTDGTVYMEGTATEVYRGHIDDLILE